MKTLYLIICVGLIAACKKDNPPPTNNTNNQNTVIDPPIPVVDLNCNFYGVINGSPFQLAQNVSGFTGSTFENVDLLPSPSYSRVAFGFRMASTSAAAAVEIIHGSAYWDTGVNSAITESQFNSFFNTHLTPGYSTDGLAGFEVRYTDNSGVVWKSNAASLNPQDVSFSNVSQDSDTSGHYSLFTLQFNCYVYNAALTDSLLIQNGKLIGWFEK